MTAKSKSGGKPILDTFVTRADKISLAYEDNTFTLESSSIDIVILEIFSMNIVSESMKRTGPLLNWESIRLHTII